MAEVVRLDLRQLVGKERAGGRRDVVLILPLPNFLIAAIAPSMRGWMLSWPGVAMKSATSPLADELDDPLAHVVARQVEILADVGQPRCSGASAL